MTTHEGWPRLCLDLSHHAWTRDTSPDAPVRTLAHAEAADRAGIDVIWVNEDLDGWDAFALLGAIAGRTSGAKLGTAVTTPFARHPNTLASSVATLDRLSDGRMVLGIGRGQSEWLDHGLGLASRDGVAALAETIRLLRQWWAPNHRASFADGEVFPVRAWERSLHPARPSIPILVAAVGPRALAMTADLADGVMLNAMASTHAVRRIVSLLRERRAELGRPVAIDWVVLKTAITVTTSDEETDRVLRRQRRVMAMINALPGMTSLIESPRWNIDEIMATVRQRLKV
ncbi:MAG: LLM class flavin-dependent oxidoreductase, partial [Chloroflexota bacterium]